MITRKQPVVRSPGRRAQPVHHFTMSAVQEFCICGARKTDPVHKAGPLPPRKSAGIICLLHGTFPKAHFCPLCVPGSHPDVSILRAHAIAAALRRARPADTFGTDADIQLPMEAWADCCRHIAPVVCTAEGVSMQTFYQLCGVPKS